jgi:hypothetical protein
MSNDYGKCDICGQPIYTYKHPHISCNRKESKIKQWDNNHQIMRDALQMILTLGFNTKYGKIAKQALESLDHELYKSNGDTNESL